MSRPTPILRTVEGLMPYRLTRKARLRRRWRPRPEVPEPDRRPVPWQPPALRRRITIEDFDGAEPVTHVIEMHRTTRIDCYRVTVDGQPWKDRIGWSRILDGLRRALPRLMSPSRIGE